MYIAEYDSRMVAVYLEAAWVYELGSILPCTWASFSRPLNESVCRL
jgi:hypothetical protein